MGASSWNQVCMSGVKDPRSRRALKRPVKYLTNSPQLLKNCRAVVPEQACSWTGDRTCEGISEFVSLAHTRLGTSGDPRSGERCSQKAEACPAEDVEMDLTGTDIPDDEFPEERQVEEVRVPKEIPNAVSLAIMRIHKNLGHPSKELLCLALRNGGANEIAIRAATEPKCDVCAENKPPKSHLPWKLADTHTEFNQGVGVDLFVLADSNEQVFEFLNIVDLNICFPVPSKRPDDVLSVLVP